MSDQVTLYSYYRSSASYRARIGLNLKEVHYTIKPVHLLNSGGEQHFEEYQKLNPMGQVPCLVHAGNTVAQSMAILFYADEAFEGRPLFPQIPAEKAKVIQVCEMVNSGIQPLQNLNVLQHLKSQYGFDSEQTKEWIGHWVNRGLSAIEKVLKETSGTYAVGGEVTAADACIIPQVFSGSRFGVTTNDYPNIERVYNACIELEAFKKAAPENQPDTPKE